MPAKSKNTPTLPYRRVVQRLSLICSVQKTAGWTFTNVDEDKVISQLKKEAASIGADAIIIGEMKEGSVPWAVQGAGGSSSLNKKSAVAAAIKFQ